MIVISQKYHQTLSNYFQNKTLYLDGANEINPNIRKLVEQPWQQIMGRMWKELEITFGFLEFIEAKLTHVNVSVNSNNDDKRFLGVYNLLDDLDLAINSPYTVNLSTQVKDQWKTLHGALVHQSQNLIRSPGSVYAQLRWEVARTSRGLSPLQSMFDSYANGIVRSSDIRIDPYLICDASLAAYPFHASTTNALSCSISTDGQIACVVGIEGRVIFFNLDSGAEISNLQLESAYSSCFLETTHTCYAVVGGRSGFVYLIDPSTGALINSNQVHHGYVFGVTSSYDGRFIASCGGEDRTLHIMDFQEMPHHYDIREIYFSFSDCTFSPCENIVAVTRADGKVCLHNPPDRNSWEELYSHQSEAMVCKISPSGIILASGDKEGELIIWDLRNQRMLWRKEATGSSLMGLVLLDDKRLITANADGSIDEYDLHSKKHVRNLTRLPRLFRLTADQLGRRMIAAAGGLWLIDHLLGHNANGGSMLATILSISALTNNQILCAGENPALSIVEITQSGNAVITMVGQEGTASHTSFSAKRKQVVIGFKSGRPNTKAGRLELRDIEGKVIKVLDEGQASEDSSSHIYDARFLGDGDAMIACFCSDSKSRLTKDMLVRWDLVKDITSKSVCKQGEGPSCLAWLDRIGIVAAGHTDGTVRLYSSTELTLLKSFKIHEGRIWSCVYAPNYGGLITAGIDGYLKVLDIETGQILTILQKELFSINACVISDDGLVLASASSNGCIRLWFSEISLSVITFYAGTHVNSLCFSPDGHKLFFGGGVGMLGYIQIIKK